MTCRKVMFSFRKVIGEIFQNEDTVVCSLRIAELYPLAWVAVPGPCNYLDYLNEWPGFFTKLFQYNFCRENLIQ